MPIKTLFVDTGKTRWLRPGTLEQALELTLDKIADDIKSAFERTTHSLSGEFDELGNHIPAEGDWKHQPEFLIESRKAYRLVYTDDAIYSWVNYGTNRTGDVLPVNKKALHLTNFGGQFSYFSKTEDYHAGTIAMPRVGFTGRRDYTEGENIYKRVKKSSIAARHFDQDIYRFMAGGIFSNKADKQYFKNALNKVLGID